MISDFFTRKFSKNIAINVAVASFYFVTGILGLSLISTSPGYATPIWVPSGLALGAALIWGLRTLPGIFLGSLLVNFYVSTHPEIYDGLFMPLLIGSMIAIGAVLQTCTGWYLVKKWIGLDNPLNHPIDVLSFAFLTGPVACLINTTWSNTVLLILNILPHQQFWFTWFTWWVGDNTGVLIITPLFLILFGQPRSVWQQRIMPIFIPLCISFVGVIILYLIANASGIKEHIWFVLVIGLLFCVLINVVLFIIQGGKNIILTRMNKQSRALKLEETKNRLILHSVGEGIFGVDNDYNITFANPAAEKMLGYSQAELIGQPIHNIVHYHHSDERPNNQFSIYKVINSDKSFHIRNESFWRKDGASFVIEYRSAPLVEHNQAIGTVIVFNDATQQRKIEIILEKMAHYDSLTDLPNRMSFIEKLNKKLKNAILNQRVMAICFIDVDNFKQINDSLGHIIGDEVLKEIPKLIEPELTKSDYLARLGGDEFAIILDDVLSMDYIKLTLQRIINNFNQPIKVDHHKIMATISIGIATYPNAGITTEELIKNADLAMYRAKEQGKNTYAFFDEEIRKNIKRTNILDKEIHNALRKNEFSLVYQPIIDASSAQLIGLEVLLRWHYPKFGEISPNEFIPIAEKNGTIYEIGNWVINKACLDYKKIKNIFKENNILLSVNISVIQLENKKFVPLLKNILCDAGMNSHNLVLEITETGLMRQPADTINIMNDIKKLGIRFALDDFGISYSSMQYLKSLPISLLKIDRTFIKDLQSDKDDITIVKAIVQLAHGLGIGTIAEGVETKEQFFILKDLKCEYIQGYYFAKPMPLEMLCETSGWYFPR